jgi:hypothetical protein
MQLATAALNNQNGTLGAKGSSRCGQPRWITVPAGVWWVSRR